MLLPCGICACADLSWWASFWRRPMRVNLHTIDAGHRCSVSSFTKKKKPFQRHQGTASTCENTWIQYVSFRPDFDWILWHVIENYLIPMKPIPSTCLQQESPPHPHRKKLYIYIYLFVFLEKFAGLQQNFQIVVVSRSKWSQENVHRPLIFDSATLIFRAWSSVSEQTSYPRIGIPPALKLRSVKQAMQARPGHSHHPPAQLFLPRCQMEGWHDWSIMHMSGKDLWTLSDFIIAIQYLEIIWCNSWCNPIT